MGIYIKGMEMPKSCDKCIYSAWSNFYQIYVCNVVRKDEPVLFGGKQIKSTAVARSARADNCPLIPVPPHGRLIDADALRSTMYHEAFETDSQMQKWDSGCWIRYKMFEQQLDVTPTIIPAEEGE